MHKIDYDLARKEMKRLLQNVHKYGYIHICRRGVPLVTCIPYKEGADDMFEGISADKISKMLEELSPETYVGRCSRCGKSDNTVCWLPHWFEGRLTTNNVCSVCYNIFKERTENVVVQKPQPDIEPEVVTSQFVCNECGKVCGNLLGLRSHMRTHPKDNLDTLEEKPDEPTDGTTTGEEETV